MSDLKYREGSVLEMKSGGKYEVTSLKDGNDIRVFNHFDGKVHLFDKKEIKKVIEY